MRRRQIVSLVPRAAAIAAVPALAPAFVRNAFADEAGRHRLLTLMPLYAVGGMGAGDE